MLVLFMGPEYGIDPAGKFLLTAVPAAGRRGAADPLHLRGRQVRRAELDGVQRPAAAGPDHRRGIVLEPGVSYTTLLIVAALAGVGGGNFASSMANINAFYPDRLKGWALGHQRRRRQPRRRRGAARRPRRARHRRRPGTPAWCSPIYIPLIVLAALGAALLHGQPAPRATTSAPCGSVPGPAHLDHVAALHRHLRLVHRLRFRLRAGAAGAVQGRRSRRRSTRPS